jgi:hypothetical protein
MAADRIAEIQARVQAATKGTWGTHYDGAVYHLAADMLVLDPSSGQPIAEIPDGDDKEQAFHDAMFIGRAPADIAFLLARVAELESALDERTRHLNGLLDALGFDEKAVPA